MKRKVLTILLSVCMATTMLAGCGNKTAKSDSSTTTAKIEATDAATDAKTETTDSVEGKKFGIIIRNAGNPYAEKEAEGFKEIIEAAGAECIIKAPEAATADAQVSLIQSLIFQEVDAIAVASNDVNALSAALQDAMDAGIKVSALDSNVAPDSRQTFVNQAGVNEIGQTLADAVYDIIGGEGQYAILSASSQSANQNSWIDSMKKIMEDDKYSKIELVEVAYGDDEPQKSTDQTQALLAKYPDMKLICSPTTVGIAAAAKVIQDAESSVKITGLGLPSEMSAYIGDDDAHACPYMFLWNPKDVGKLSAYTSIALVEGKITGASGETFDAGDMENSPYTITDCDDGGTEVILGPPYKFDAANINEWKDVY